MVAAGTADDARGTAMDALLPPGDGPNVTNVTTLVLATPIRQATSDAHLLDLWLYGRSPHTVRSYRRTAGRFLAFVGVPLPAVTLGDVRPRFS
jgi:hypothetical protein